MRKFTNLTALAVVAVVLAIAGCAGGKKNKVVVRLRAHPFTSVIEKWTQTGTIYHKFDTVLVANAIYKSPKWRKEYVNAFARGNLLPEAELIALKKEMGDRQKKYTEFLLSIYTSDPQWNDVADESSVWHIYLERDGQRVEPSEIKLLKKGEIPLQKLYRHFTPWKKVYELQFEGETPVIGDFDLVITSLLGSVRMDWKDVN